MITFSTPCERVRNGGGGLEIKPLNNNKEEIEEEDICIKKGKKGTPGLR